MFLVRQILPAAIIAMMAAAGVCGLALFCRGERRSLFGPLAAGIGYLAGHLFVTGWISFPPTDTTNWLPFFAATAAILGLFWASWRNRPWVRLAIFGLLSVGAMRLLLRPKFQYGWSLAQGWTLVICLACALAALALILDLIVRRAGTPVETPGFLLIICGGIFGSLMLSGSMLLGQLAVILGAALFGVALLLMRGIPFSSGMGPVFSLTAGALLVSGYFFASLPLTSAALLAFAPILALIPIPLANRYLGVALRAALVLVPVAAALVLAFLSSPPLDY